MRMRDCGLLMAMGAALGLLPGCTGGLPHRFLSLIGLSQKPLVMAFVLTEHESEGGLATLVNPFAPYRPLNEGLGHAVGRQVVEDVCFPFQLGPSLQLGVAHLAMISPVHYAQLSRSGKFEVLAVSADENGQVARPGLLIVPASSPVRDVAELRGKIVAFGPPSDGRTHEAALLLLAENGLKPTDLALEALPVVGSLKTFPKSKDVAQSVMNGSSDAGFVDESAWNAWAATQPPREGEPTQGRFRVIAKTMPVPDYLVVASPALDATTASATREFLLGVDKSNPKLLESLRTSGYRSPDADLLAACARLLPAEASSPLQPGGGASPSASTAADEAGAAPRASTAAPN